MAIRNLSPGEGLMVPRSSCQLSLLQKPAIERFRQVGVREWAEFIPTRSIWSFAKGTAIGYKIPRPPDFPQITQIDADTITKSPGLYLRHLRHLRADEIDSTH